MKIFQLCYALASGGAERFIVDLCNELVNQGHDVTLCILLSDRDKNRIFCKRFLDVKVKFRSLGFSQGFSLYKTYKICSYIIKEKPDVVHCHLNVIPYIFPLPFINKRIKIFHTIHNIASAACGPKYQKPLNRFFYKKNLIRPITISRICRDSFTAFYNIENITCIENGRTSVNPTPDFKKVQDEIKNITSGKNTVIFTHIARFNSQKNQDCLIESFNELDKQHLNFVLLVIGSGFDSVEGFNLQSKACSKIHFLGEKANIGDYLFCSDAFCLSSKYEGLPITLLEALSCGVTPICTPVGGIPDVIRDGITGYLSENTTKEAFISSIKRFIDHPLSSSVLKEHFKNEFSIEKCTSKYLSEYNK